MSQNVIYWSGDEDELLIEFVKDHEILYNVKSKDFKKIHLKQYLWCEIGGILNKTDVDCRKRWSYVRDYYIRRRGKPGTGGEAALKRAVLLSFLDAYNSSRRSAVANITGDENSEDIFNNDSADKDTTQVDNNNDEDESPSDEEESSRNYLLNDRRHHQTSNSSQPATSKKRKWSWHSEDRLQSDSMHLDHRIPAAQGQHLDETDHFFMSMAQITKQLPRYDRAQLRMQIASLVGNAELQHLSKTLSEFRESRDSDIAASGNSLYRPSRSHRPASSKEQSESTGLTKHEAILP